MTSTLSSGLGYERCSLSHRTPHGTPSLREHRTVTSPRAKPYRIEHHRTARESRGRLPWGLLRKELPQEGRVRAGPGEASRKVSQR